jgi:hypothetical protein
MPEPSEPSRDDLTDALWESYATSRASARGSREPVPLAELVRVLGDDLRIRGDERRRQPIPRVVLGVALWNLALRNLDPSTIPPGDRAAVTQLDTLVKEVFGWSLLEIRVMRRQNIDPLLMVARQYAIFDYRWEPPQPDAPPIGAKLEILLQRPLEQFKEALDPANWSKKCDLLWANVRATQPRSIARQRPTRAFLAELNLPGPGRDGSPEVIVESDLFEIPSGSGTHSEYPSIGESGPACHM